MNTMLIKNKYEIISNSSSLFFKKLRSDCIKIIEYSLEIINPQKLILEKVRRDEDNLKISNTIYKLSSYDRVFVIGGGKAGDSMAEAIEKIIGDKITQGIINIPYERNKNEFVKNIILNGSSHPIPDKNSVNGVNLMLKTLKNITEHDLIIFLISGGASSLMISPADGISLENYQNLVNSLLKKGVNIDELNTVRKHIDNIKGGKILKNCYPATVISLLLSDVIEDNLSVIGSGLTAQDFTNYSDAINILKKYRVWKLTSSNLREYLIKGLESEKNGKNKINNKYFERVKNFVVGSNNDAVEAAFNESNSLGYNSMILTTNASSEAKYAGLLYSSIAKEVFLHDRPLKKPAAIIVGGETTVTVKGKGVGGRNQELVLSAASKISNTPCVIASIGTDGIDGNSNAAGAIADGETTNRAYTLKINPLKMLNINDSNTFFQRLNDTIITGYTGTNVNDLSIILIGLD